MLDGVSLLVAIPVTILYKLFIEKAPFKEGDRAPLPPLPLQAVGGKPKLAKADASPRVSMLAEDADMAEEESLQTDEVALKGWTYASGFAFSVLGYGGAAIDVFEYWNITKVAAAADREAKSLGREDIPDSVKDKLETLTKGVRAARASARFTTLMCLLPLDEEDKTYAWQWAVFALTASGLIKDLVLYFVPVGNEKADTAGSVWDAIVDIGTMILELIILIKEEQATGNDEHDQADKVMKFIEYILSNGGGLLLDWQAFKTEPNVYVFVAGEGCVLRGADLNTCRVVYNIFHKAVHDNS
jgi:hypothetical protein